MNESSLQERAAIFMVKWRKEKEKAFICEELFTLLGEAERKNSLHNLTTAEQVVENPWSKYHLMMSLTGAILIEERKPKELEA